MDAAQAVHDEETVDQHEVVNQVYAFAAEQVRQGVTGPDLRVALENEGLDPEAAAAVAADFERARREAGKKAMLSGAAWCIGGIVVTAVTYQSAAPGQTYVVAWGAILFGAIEFFKGMAHAAS